MVLFYLEYENPTLIDILVNKILSNFINESYFYIPQFITLILNKNNLKSLESYLFHQCVNSIKFSLYVNWMISSNSEKSKEKKNLDFLSGIEMAFVNGNKINLNIKEKIPFEFILNENMNKQYRINYYNKCLIFYKKLKNLCEKLFEHPKKDTNNPKNERNYKLKQYLKNTNKEIENMFKKEDLKFANNVIKGFYRGIILPFDDTETINDEDCNLIVNFLCDSCFCYNTKNRVPIKLIFECVQVKDLINYKKLISNEEKNNFINNFNSVEEFLNEINEDENIKKQKEIEIQKIVNDINYYNFHPNEKPNFKQIEENVKKVKRKFSYDSTLLNDNLENPFGISWKKLCLEIKKNSKFKNFPSYSIKSFIAKSNDDLRQEALIMQLLKLFNETFKKEKIPLKLKTYEIIVTSKNSGLIEFIPNSISIDSLKKNLKDSNLNNFFRTFFAENFEEAQKNFCESLASYSLITYLLNIKDRHNGNILLDMNGKIIHIDFGFILGISPGKINFETAPFKLTKEYIEILDGEQSSLYYYFKTLLIRGFLCLKKHFVYFEKIINIMAKYSFLPCFVGRNVNDVIKGFIERFHIEKTDVEFNKFVEQLIYDSINSWRTYQYDLFQELTNGIMQ